MYSGLGPGSGAGQEALCAATASWHPSARGNLQRDLGLLGLRFLPCSHGQKPSSLCAFSHLPRSTCRRHCLGCGHRLRHELMRALMDGARSQGCTVFVPVHTSVRPHLSSQNANLWDSPLPTSSYLGPRPLLCYKLQLVDSQRDLPMVHRQQTAC